MIWVSNILTCACSSYANIASEVTQGPIFFLSGVRAWCIRSTAETTKEAAAQCYVPSVAHCTVCCKPTWCCIAARTCLSTARTSLEQFLSLYELFIPEQTMVDINDLSWTLQVLNWMAVTSSAWQTFTQNLVSTLTHTCNLHLPWGYSCRGCSTGPSGNIPQHLRSRSHTLHFPLLCHFHTHLKWALKCIGKMHSSHGLGEGQANHCVEYTSSKLTGNKAVTLDINSLPHGPPTALGEKSVVGPTAICGTSEHDKVSFSTSWSAGTRRVMLTWMCGMYMCVCIVKYW